MKAFLKLTLYLTLPFVFVLNSHAENFRCKRGLSYVWEKVNSSGKKVRIREKLDDVQEEGAYEDYVKTRLMRLTSQLKEEAMNTCRGLHEGAELCLLRKLEEKNTNLYELDFEKRQAIIAGAREDCSASSGTCISVNVTDAACEAITNSEKK